jgi:2-polyprenyl-3-methyl-5-hydroxy-6-metoxy-1,4-benzoquinol methylase
MEKSKYYTGARNEMLEFIPISANTFLDIGCGDGNFGVSIKKNAAGSIVWGAELFPDAAAIAAESLDNVIVGDIVKLVDKLPDAFFDCITFNDSLEHLEDPFTLLEKLKSKLSPKGVIVSSIPNIRHYKALRSLVFGKDWKYVDAGTLDRTHLRFFTEKSIIRMFTESGYEIESIKGINKTKRGKMRILSKLSLGWLEDTLYLQYASRVKPRKT